LSSDLKSYAEAQEDRAPLSPKNHPDDVRFYLAIGVCVVIGIVILAQMIDAIAISRFCSLQTTLDAFGLYDAALFGIVGTVLGFYFASKR
jgi:uncharacterized membrane protein YdcZ (DUF606 family)